jgi:hypothetical protein
MNMKEHGINRKRRMIVSRENWLKFFNPLSEPRGSLQAELAIAPIIGATSGFGDLAHPRDNWQIW